MHPANNVRTTMIIYVEINKDTGNKSCRLFLFSLLFFSATRVYETTFFFRLKISPTQAEKTRNEKKFIPIIIHVLSVSSINMYYGTHTNNFPDKGCEAVFLPSLYILRTGSVVARIFQK